MLDNANTGATALAESHYREMLEAFDEGFCVIEVLFADDKPVDYRFLEVNRAFAEQTGLSDARGKTARSLVPDLEPRWFELYGRVARTGEPERFTDRAEAMGRDYDVYAFRVGESKDCRVGVLFKDVTKQRQAEAAVEKFNRELEERVRARTREVRVLAARLTLAESQERARLAQLLHDDLQQQLYAMGFALRELRSRVQPDSVSPDKLAELRRLLDYALETSRTITTNLSPPLLHHEGLAEALAWLASDMASRFNLKVHLRVEGLLIPNEAVRVLLFGLVRELLFNVVKHAEVDEATVSGRQDEDALTLVVEDRGRGFDGATLAAGGIGLSGVRQRLELFGGRLELSSAPGKGTHAAIVLPEGALLSVSAASPLYP